MILITGAAGFIGSTLANSYSKSGKVVIIDNLSTGNKSNIEINQNIIFIKGDISDSSLMENIFQKYQFDYIFHLAAIASVADSVRRPLETNEINFQSVLNILELIRKSQHEIKRFVFASSAAVYGDDPTLPKYEESVIRPLTPYAIDKFAAEKYVLAYNNLYGVPTSAVRFFNVFGPKQNPKSAYSGVISILVDKYKLMLNNQEAYFTIFGDGSQSRDFIYIEDVVQSLELVAKSSKSLGKVFNVGTGCSTTLLDLIEVMNGILNVKLPIRYEEVRSGDIRDSLANISKIKKLGFKPTYSVGQGIQKYLEYEFSE